jgi:hypothetical protein
MKRHQVSCPPTPKMLINVFEPKEFNNELTEAFEHLYINWAVPQLGRRRAYIWAWLQVFRTALIPGIRLGLDVLDRIYYRRRAK